MAYETGGASNVYDLMEKLRVFAIAQGWTVETTGTQGADVTTILLAKGGRFFTFGTQVTGGSSGDPASRFGAQVRAGAYSSLQGLTIQTNAGPVVYSNNMPGPFQSYHFFAGANVHGESYLHIVVEAFPGSFRHIGVGTINRAGEVSTGDYSFASRWNYDPSYVGGISHGYQSIPFDSSSYTGQTDWGTVIRADGDGVSPRYGKFNASTSQTGGFARIRGGIFRDESGLQKALAIGPSQMTGRAILVPIMAAIERPSGFASLLGGPADMRFVNITNMEPGDTLSIGPDQWKVFPIIRKNGASGQENSGAFGYAYRVIP